MRHGYNGGVTMIWSTGTFANGSRFILLYRSGRKPDLAFSLLVRRRRHLSTLPRNGFLANRIVTDDTLDNERPHSLK
jgi:hypothetical protein